MAPRARHSTARLAYDDFGADELIVGERIGSPLRRSGRKARLRGLIILITLGGGWVLLGGQASLPEWLVAQIAALPTSIERLAAGLAEPARATMATTSARVERVTKPPVLEPIPSSPPLAASRQPGIAPDATAPPQTTASLAPVAATETDEPKAEPLPPPTIDPADPYQARALSVGLHPDLSRVLLARLSPTDYRNAEIAIQTAMAETPDRGVFVWPRQRKPDLALFQVRFVAGAAPTCRRYVVSVTKDGWLTTAPPMEKCGPQPSPPRHQ
jgi:hypothetical protein